MSIIFALFSLSIIVLVHEFGHYVAAKSVGIPVPEFSVGMGKSIFKKNFGGTEFSLRILPIGGYVRVSGMDVQLDKEDFVKISFINKLKILVSGSFYNFLFAWLVFFLITFFMGVPRFATNTIDYVYPDSPAFVAGFVKGDKVVLINEQLVANGKEVLEKIALAETNELFFVVKRGEIKRTITVVPANENGKKFIGVRFLIGRQQSYSLFKSLEIATTQCASLVKSIFNGLMLLVNREVSLDQVYGPVGIISLIGQASTHGFVYFFGFLALLSINLAVINLLPIPALDGGRIVIAVIDKLLGEKISNKLESKLHFIGFIVLILFVIYISYFDIHKILVK